MNTDSIKTYIEKNFSEKRKLHTEGVRVTAIDLAKKYGADPEKAETAALFHDMYRGVSVDVLNYYVKHGKIAAIVMERDFGITDPDIINAVSYHTTGRPAMSALEKVIYIADAIEPNRNYPGVEAIRKMAEEDLDKACLLSMDRTIEYVQQQGNFLDTDTIAARNDLKETIRHKGE